MSRSKISCVLPCHVQSATEYFHLHDNVPMEKMDEYMDNEEKYELWQAVNQIIAIKHSIFLLRNVGGMCESVPDSLVSLKKKLIKELQEKHGYVFDEKWFKMANATL